MLWFLFFWFRFRVCASWNPSYHWNQGRRHKRIRDNLCKMSRSPKYRSVAESDMASDYKTLGYHQIFTVSYLKSHPNSPGRTLTREPEPDFCQMMFVDSSDLCCVISEGRTRRVPCKVGFWMCRTRTISSGDTWDAGGGFMLLVVGCEDGVVFLETSLPSTPSSLWDIAGNWLFSQMNLQWGLVRIYIDVLGRWTWANTHVMNRNDGAVSHVECR